MKIRDVLAGKGARVVTIRADATLATAVHRLAVERIGALVVSEDGQRIGGILSERDIVRALAADGADLLGSDRRVTSVMTKGVVTCGPDDSIRSVMAEMTRRRFRHCPVVEEARLSGLVSIGDLVKHRLEEIELEANVLREAYLAVH